YITTDANAYVFNNVLYDTLMYNSGGFSPNNCYILGTVANHGTEQLYFYNNTTDYSGGGCEVNASGANAPNAAWNGIFNFENDHFIGYFPATLSGGVVHVSSGASATITDHGGEIFQTEAVANGQGYVVGNNYAPTLGSN